MPVAAASTNPFLDRFLPLTLGAPSCAPPVVCPYRGLVPWYSRLLSSSRPPTLLLLSHRTHCWHDQACMTDDGNLPRVGFGVKNRVAIRADMVGQVTEPETVYLCTRSSIDHLPLRPSAASNWMSGRRGLMRRGHRLWSFSVSVAFDFFSLLSIRVLPPRAVI